MVHVNESKEYCLGLHQIIWGSLNNWGVIVVYLRSFVCNNEFRIFYNFRLLNLNERMLMGPWSPRQQPPRCKWQVSWIQGYTRLSRRIFHYFTSFLFPLILWARKILFPCLEPTAAPTTTSPTSLASPPTLAPIISVSPTTAMPTSSKFWNVFYIDFIETK